MFAVKIRLTADYEAAVESSANLSVAVGTALALTDLGRPPHRSQRAGLPHWALASGADVEAAVGPGMDDAGRREPAGD